MKNLDNAAVKNRLIVVTGLAGAGKTIALRALEDLGYYCVDNLPSALYPAFLAALEKNELPSTFVALALDSRDTGVPSALCQNLILSKEKFQFDLVYLEADKSHLVKRFRETRREHPLSRAAGEDGVPLGLTDALDRDVKLLEPVKQIATRVLVTSELTTPALQQLMRHGYSPSAESQELLLSVVSFGFKYGPPQELDMIFDVRCFRNPHYVEELRSMTGLDSEIHAFVFADKNVPVFVDKVSELLEFLYPLYRAEGKRYFEVGFGCTGGRHRSVAISEEIATRLKKNFSFVKTEHRHLDRD